MNFGEYLLIASSVSDETNQLLLEASIPQRIRRKNWLRITAWLYKTWSKAKEWVMGLFYVKTPANLNSLTIGQYLYLTSRTNETFATAAMEVVYHVSQAEMALMDTFEVYGCLRFIQEQLKAINEALASTNIEPSAEEKKAGVASIDIPASYNLIDYICTKLHCTIEEAETTTWTRVYMMLKADKERELYRRRLQNEYKNKR